MSNAAVERKTLGHSAQRLGLGIEEKLVEQKEILVFSPADHQVLSFPRGFFSWGKLMSSNTFRGILALSLLSFLGVLLIAPHALADNIAIANATACSGTVPGGTICTNGSGGLVGTGGTPFSLSGIQNGTIVLQAVIGTQTAPVYQVVNDTGSTVTSFSFVFTGTLPSNQFIDCQTNGGFSGANCSISGASGTVGKNAQYGPGGTFPATITFTGLNIAPGSTFDVVFSSFANGASGSVTGTPVPEPSTLLLFVSGLLGIAVVIRKRTQLPLTRTN